MKNRIEILRKYIDGVILNMSDHEERRCAYIHLYGVSHFCAFIALKRKQNVELATIAGMLHDFYSYKMTDTEQHGPKGAVLAKQTLDLLKITDSRETELICSAIDVHSDKKNKHSDFSEVLVDADTLQQYLYNISISTLDEYRAGRIKKLKEEFGIV